MWFLHGGFMHQPSLRSRLLLPSEPTGWPAVWGLLHADWLAGWLPGWLAGWLAGQHRLPGWVTDRRADGSSRRLRDRQSCWLPGLLELTV